MSELKDNVSVPSVAIDWYRTFPWWSFGSKSITIAWRLTHLLAGSLAVFLILVGWALAAKLFGSSNSFEWPPMRNAPLIEIWLGMSHAIFSFEPGGGVRELARVLFGGLWTTVVVAFFGGLLARRSVFELGMQSASDWTTTYRLVLKRMPSLLWTIAMPWCAVGLMLIPFFILGLIGRLGGVGEWLAGIAFVIALLLLIAIGWTALLGALGFPMAVTAVVTEKHADAFDGFSRSAAYLYQKPFTYGLGVLIASGIAVMASRAVQFAMELGRDACLAAFEAGSGKTVVVDGKAMNVFFDIAIGFVQFLSIGFLFSFFWSASAALYLTLRNEVDHTDFDDIDLQEQQPAKAVPTIGQPPAADSNPALSGVHEQAE